jgi:hypothetical protein
VYIRITTKQFHNFWLPTTPSFFYCDCFIIAILLFFNIITSETFLPLLRHIKLLFPKSFHKKTSIPQQKHLPLLLALEFPFLVFIFVVTLSLPFSYVSFPIKVLSSFAILPHCKSMYKIAIFLIELSSLLLLQKQSS